MNWDRAWLGSCDHRGCLTVYGPFPGDLGLLEQVSKDAEQDGWRRGMDGLLYCPEHAPEHPDARRLVTHDPACQSLREGYGPYDCSCGLTVRPEMFDDGVAWRQRRGRKRVEATDPLGDVL